MTLEEIKNKIVSSVDSQGEDIIEIGEKILNNPELGYCENKTSETVRKAFEKLEIEYEYPLALTGVKAKIRGRAHKYNVCIIGEMDALKCEGKTAHKCGHNAQIAAMLGAAAAIKKSGIMSGLDGDITFMAVPGEEFIDLEYRKSLKKNGEIKYYGGKQQLIYEGAFDDADMAMMLHAKGNEEKPKLYLKGHNLGFLAKTITIRGKAVHGSTPFEGINALNAAALAILGIHSNRETFRDEDSIRIHPIITKGGDVVNSVPDEVCIDTYIRGASFEAIKKGNAAVERSTLGACQIIGAKAEFEDIPGYLPLKEDDELSEVMENVAAELIGKENLVFGEEITGSTDIGDLSMLIPVIQPSIGGFCGTLHSPEFEITDRETAYLTSAKLLACTAAELLYNNAEKARLVKENFKGQMTKEQYIKYLNQED